MTPPTGPDSMSVTGMLAAAPTEVTPPLDCMMSSVPANCLAFSSRSSFSR
jgi:hypothetical protein